MPRISELRCFVVAVEESSIGRAARRLSVSQPAMSMQLRTLEHVVGVHLFSRDAREFMLTPAGAALLPHAKAILAAWDTAQAAIEQAERN